MALSEAQKRAKAKYLHEKRDRLMVEIPKGKRDAYHLIANALGLSLARLVQHGVEEFAQNHGAEVPREVLEAEQNLLTMRERVLLARFNGLPEKAQENFIRLMGDLAERIKADETGAR